MSPSIITHSQSAGYKPPIVGELEAMFRILPDDELLARLRGPRRRGRPGYDPEILWRCYVVYYLHGLASVSDLIRLLRDNPFIAAACGIDSEIPSQPTLSRFGAKLAKPSFTMQVKNIMRALTRSMYDRFADFGKSVAIDSTDIRAWSHGNKKGKNGKPTDPDAGWCVKTNTEGNKKFVWGYKVHILADTLYELPLTVDISAGNVSDIRRATPLLAQARYTYGKFHPQYVICDAGYSSNRLRKVIKRQYRAIPVIDPNPAHKSAMKLERVPEWKSVYNRRTAIERLNGRLKAFRKLNDVRVRGRFKVRLHALLSVIMLQARALAFPDQLRRCVRAVASPNP
jgi:transposase